MVATVDLETFNLFCCNTRLLFYKIYDRTLPPKLTVALDSSMVKKYISDRVLSMKILFNHARMYEPNFRRWFRILYRNRLPAFRNKNGFSIKCQIKSIISKKSLGYGIVHEIFLPPLFYLQVSCFQTFINFGFGFPVRTKVTFVSDVPYVTSLLNKGYWCMVQLTSHSQCSIVLGVYNFC